MNHPSPVRSLFAVIALLAGVALGETAEPVARLKTPWTDKVDPNNVLGEYPRPQMVRKNWQNLNGKWDYAIRPKGEGRPEKFDGKILVPFAVESYLSGVQKTVGEGNRLWYRRKVKAKTPSGKRRLYLNFGAVDWETVVWVNGKKVGEHRGGYDPFRFDITDTLDSGGTQEVVVSVWDPTDKGTQPRGKQVSEPRGIWYTAVTGIWQTVWLEELPAAHIESLQIVPDLDKKEVRVTVETTGAKNALVFVTIASVSTLDKFPAFRQTEGIAKPGVEVGIEPSVLYPWTPEEPWLYDLRIELIDPKGGKLDSVTSYFGMRKIEVKKDADGHPRLALNGKIRFQFGPLDQGWWPDGLYTAPTDEALRYDIEKTKELGFDMIRKHVKVEPARWYTWCDRIGMLVWQDMPNGNLRRDQPKNLRVGPFDEKDADRPPASAQQFEGELKAMIQSLYNHPSIVMWVPFNEGWGQYQTKRTADFVKVMDPTRIVTAVSGWTDRGVGDTLDIHNYPGPALETDGKRVAILGEFGGLGWPVEKHLWGSDRNWGYRTYFSRKELNAHYAEVVGNVYGLIGQGLAAAVYTQTTDVEGEVNGLMTYDRQLVKIDVGLATALAKKLSEPGAKATTLRATSAKSGQSWLATRKVPADGWTNANFDDSKWQNAKGPFQSGGVQAIPKGTPWKTKGIWLRSTFQVDSIPASLWMAFYQNADSMAVYINGKLVKEFRQPRPTGRHYRQVHLTDAPTFLKKGENVIAVRATKNRGPHAIDVGLFGLDKPQGKFAAKE